MIKDGHCLVSLWLCNINVSETQAFLITFKLLNPALGKQNKTQIQETAGDHFFIVFQVSYN